jgi:hypothetical protein
MPKDARAKQKRDNQVIELRGRALLVEQLFAAGIEVATPVRDRGVDLIAYIDRDAKSYVSRPIQLRAFRKEGIKLDKKHARFPGLILALVCYIDEPDRTVTYALPYRDAIDLFRKRKLLKWNKRDSYYRGSFGRELLAIFTQRFRMTDKCWRVLIQNNR